MKNGAMMLALGMMLFLWVGCRSSGAFRTSFQDVSSSELRAIQDAHYVLELVAVGQDHYQFVTCHRNDSQKLSDGKVGCVSAFLTAGGQGLMIPRAALEKKPQRAAEDPPQDLDAAKAIAAGSILTFSGISLFTAPVPTLMTGAGVGAALFVLGGVDVPACATSFAPRDAASLGTQSGGAVGMRRVQGVGEKLFHRGASYHHYYNMMLAHETDEPFHDHHPAHDSTPTPPSSGTKNNSASSPQRDSPPASRPDQTPQPSAPVVVSPTPPSTTTSGDHPTKPTSPVLGDGARVRVVSPPPSTTTSGDHPTKPVGPILADDARTRVVSPPSTTTSGAHPTKPIGPVLADDARIRVVSVAENDEGDTQDLEVEDSQVLGCAEGSSTLGDQMHDFWAPGFKALAHGARSGWKNVSVMIWGREAETLRREWSHVVGPSGTLPKPVSVRIPDVLPHLAQMIEELDWNFQGALTHHCLPRGLDSERKTIPACKPLSENWHSGGMFRYIKPTQGG